MGLINVFGGGFQDGAGNPLAFGILYLELNQDACVIGTAQVVSQLPIAITLDDTGNAPNTPIWFNDQLTPSGTYYFARLFSASGEAVWSAVPNWSFTGTSPINLDNMILSGTVGPGGTVAVIGGYPAGANIVSLPQFNGEDGGLQNYTLVLKIPAAQVLATGTSVVLTFLTGSATGFAWQGCSIGATLPGVYAGSTNSTAWTTWPVGVYFPTMPTGVSSFAATSTRYSSSPTTITIDTQHDYYITMYLPGTNAANVPFFNAGGQCPQLNGLGGYVSGDHTFDDNSSLIQSPASGYHGFVGVTIG
jgi:hypothetical protein